MRHGQKQSDNVPSSRIPCEVVHTPGPWVANIMKDGGNWTYEIRTEKPAIPGYQSGKHIATINKYAKCGDWSCAEENMNLLAAAPELLATLEDIVDEADRYAARTGKKVTWADDVKGLIKKAKGEA